MPHMPALPSACLLAGALLVATPCAAQPATGDDLLELDLTQLLELEVFVASRLGTSVRKAPGSVSVISRSDIEASGARDINELLRAVPGMEVSIAPANGPGSQYRIRGLLPAGNPHTLFLLNGSVLPNLDNGGRPPQFRLPLAMIERIEVVRGPGSAAFGADAFAGVVNIVTRRPSELPANWLELGAGSFAQRDASVGVRGALGPGQFSASIETQRNDGDHGRRIAADQQTLLDGFFGSNASLAPGPIDSRYRLGHGLLQWQGPSLHATLWLWRGEFGLGAGPVQALTDDARDRYRAEQLDIDWRLPFSDGNWEHRLRWVHRNWQQRAEYDVLPDGVLLPIGSDGNVDPSTPVGLVEFVDGLRDHQHLRLRSDTLEAESRWQGARHRLRLAIGWQQQRFALLYNARNYGAGVIDGSQAEVGGALVDVTGTAFAALPDVSRRLWFASFEDEFQISEQLSLNAGIRHDRYSDFGSSSNPRLALLWQPGAAWTLKLLAGRAFRAPNNDELYARNRGTFRGNPLLQPETNRTFELSALYNPDPRGWIELALFRYQARDVIERVFDPDTSITTLANSAGIDAHGGELSAAWQGQRLFLRGSFSLALPESAGDGLPLPHVARRHANLELRWRFDARWSLQLGVDRVMDRRRADGDLRPDTPDYTWIDLALLASELRTGLDARLLVSNLGNADARAASVGNLPDDLPLPGRSLWLGLRWQWR